MEHKIFEGKYNPNNASIMNCTFWGLTLIPSNYAPNLVYGNQNSFFFVNEDNILYASGNNDHGKLGITSQKETPIPAMVMFPWSHFHWTDNPKKKNLVNFLKSFIANTPLNLLGTIVNYCQAPNNTEWTTFKKVVDIVQPAGVSSAFFLINDGTLFASGHGINGLMGNNKTSDQKIPVQCNVNVRITSIACGDGHVISICEKGNLYSWGHGAYGQLGLSDNKSSLVPTKNPYLKEPIDQVAAGYRHSIALTRTGKVFVWGYNNDGQVGNGNKTSQNQPRHIDSLKTCIKQVVASYWNSFALTNDGNLFAWGYKTVLGCQATGDSCIPIASAMCLNGQITSIGSHPCVSFVGLQTYSNTIWMFGIFRGTTYQLPYKSRCLSLDELFFQESKTYRPFNRDLDSYPKSTFSSCFVNAFNDENTHDIVFLADGKKIFAHTAIIFIRSKYLTKKIKEKQSNSASKNIIRSKNIQEEQSNSAEIPVNYSYNCYYAFLNYLYTDKLHVKPIIAMEIMDLSMTHKDAYLMYLCECIIRQDINTQNAAKLLILAEKYKMEKFEKFVMQFIMLHLTKVMLSDGFTSLEAPTLIKISQRLANEGKLPT